MAERSRLPGFVVAGSIAFAVDAAISTALVHAGIPALIARPFAIGPAMVVGWLINRRLTFGVSGRPSVAEFGRYAGVNFVSIAVNYATYAAVLELWPDAPLLLALIAGTTMSFVFSFLGYCRYVFVADRA